MNSPRKIIHIDMDCFYAAIEIRDNPVLADKPVAVGGSIEQRGVISTSNYIARQYGVRSAMATGLAFRLCKNLVLLPVNMKKYKEVAERIQQIFYNYTHLVEPLSLDEAYLDVTHAMHHQGSATLIAHDIRKKIWEAEQLTASAGISNNKLLAKIASGWKKPNGLFVIRPQDVTEFIKTLPVAELYGVGKVTAEKLYQRGLQICEDLQKISYAELVKDFGNKLGHQLYEQCRGMDERLVEPHRERKSVSVEHTFPEDISNRDMCLGALKLLYEKLLQRVEESGPQPIKNQFIKIKFNNFRQITAEVTSQEIQFEIFKNLFNDAYAKVKLPVRLLGLGVHFNSNNLFSSPQKNLF